MYAYIIISGSGLFVNSGIDKVFLDEDLANKYICEYNKSKEKEWALMRYEPYAPGNLLAHKLKMKINKSHIPVV